MTTKNDEAPILMTDEYDEEKMTIPLEELSRGWTFRKPIKNEEE